ncbi:MAG: efflux transporter outer membrane subunit [Rubrivivax sp.]|nr:efflux transporter outer membrane subunit [Rubrivivax sp.]
MKPSSRALVTLAAAALLSACATAPDPSPPPAGPALPTRWQAPLPHDGAAADLAQWWARFNDPVLLPLQEAAQQASPTLASALARVERARASRAAAGAAGAPRLDAVASASSARQLPGQRTAHLASAGLQAAWELDLFGAVAAGRQAAQARLEGAQAGWHDARVSVAAEVASSYTALRACEAQLAQTRLDTASRAETARLTDLSARSGFTAPADAALARAGAAQARGQWLSQQAQCDTLLKGLVEITDLPEPDLRQRLAAGSARLPQPAPLSLTALPAALLSQRPDLAAAAREVVAAAADRSQSQARELPQISLSGSLAGASLRSGGVTNNGATWSIGPVVVSLPLFDGGARTASTAAARASYDEAVALYAAQLRRAVREVETALVALDSTAQREVDALSAARDFEASLVATQARQQGGLASLFDLEAARRNAVLAQSTLIELQRERVTAWISLYRALGGGWTATDDLARTAAVQP